MRQIFAQQRSGLCAMVGAARKMFLVLLGPCALEVCEKEMRKVSWPVVALTGHMFISIIPMSLATLPYRSRVYDVSGELHLIFVVWTVQDIGALDFFHKIRHGMSKVVCPIE